MLLSHFSKSKLEIQGCLLSACIKIILLKNSSPVLPICIEKFNDSEHTEWLRQNHLYNEWPFFTVLIIENNNNNQPLAY